VHQKVAKSFRSGRVLLADVPGRRISVYAPHGRLLGYFAIAGLPQGIAVGPTGAIAVADPYAASLGHLALTLALLGHIDRGRARVDEGVSGAVYVNCF